MLVRITLLLRLTIHVGFVSTTVVVLSIVVLASIIIATSILTTGIIEHRPVSAVAVIHLLNVRCAVLRILLAVSIGVTIAWICLTLVLQMTSVLSMLARDSWRRGILSTTLSILTHARLRTRSGILTLSFWSRGAECAGSTLGILALTIPAIVVVGVPTIIRGIIVLRSSRTWLTGDLVGEWLLGWRWRLCRLRGLTEWIVRLLGLLSISVLLCVCR